MKHVHPVQAASAVTHEKIISVTARVCRRRGFRKASSQVVLRLAVSVDGPFPVVSLWVSSNVHQTKEVMTANKPEKL